MPEVKLTRPTGYRTDRLRAYQIYIDGQKVGKISPDGVQAFELQPGAHMLQLKMDWVSSKKLRFALDENARQTFVCAPKVKRNQFSILKGYELIYWMSIGCKRYIDLCREEEFIAEDKRWISKLKGSTLFFIALAISIAVATATGEFVAISAVLITACVFVILGIVFRPVDRAFSKINEKSSGQD